MKIPEYTESQPRLIDKAIADLRSHLRNNLTWLNNAFWLAKKVQFKVAGSSDMHAPAINIGNGEYLSMLPNTDFGNYVFFESYDPQLMDTKVPTTRVSVIYQLGIVFWGNLANIYPDAKFHSIETWKYDILKVLRAAGIFKPGISMQILRVYDRVEFVFNQTAIKDIGTQFLTHPYGGLRFVVQIKINELC